MALHNCTETRDNFWESPSHVVSMAFLMYFVIVFIISFITDAVENLKSRAHWIHVLSSLTVQMLSITLNGSKKEPLASERKNISVKEFWIIHTGRLMVCVVLGYVMPGMANLRSEEFWGNLTALALMFFVQVNSELIHIDSKFPGSYLTILWPKQECSSVPLYYTFSTLLFFSSVLLFFLLGCANIAGRGIKRIVAQKIPVILKGQVEEDHHHPHHHSYEGLWRAEEDHHYHFRCKDCWRLVEVAVLRAWIVARAYSPKYIIARSALASSAAAIVTFQIVITIVGGVCNSSKLVICNTRDRLIFALALLKCVFILIGWSMIGWRWATAVAYYGSWSNFLQIEDFWTRYLRELQQSLEPMLLKAKLLDIKIDKLVPKESRRGVPPRILLHAVIRLQWFMVSFSKACWLASFMIFRNKLMGKLFSKIFRKHKMYLFEDYRKYRKILEDVQMFGESPKILWVANRKSIQKARRLILKGNQDAEFICEDLVDFLCSRTEDGTEHRPGLSCLEPYKPQTVLNFLCKKRPQEESDVEKESLAVDMSRKSWKMTAVSLLSIIVHLSPIYADVDERCSTSHASPPRGVKDCLNAYSQAWEIIDFVEEADTEADGITSEAADKYFLYLQDLQEGVDNGDFPASYSGHATPECVRSALEELKEESKSKTEPLESVNFISQRVYALAVKGEKEKRQGHPNKWTGNESIDLKAAAWGSAVYKLCNSIQCNEDTDVIKLLKELESSLADIINECLEKIQHLLLVNSTKWAVDGDGRRIAKALYTTGKVRLIMERLETRRAAERRS